MHVSKLSLTNFRSYPQLDLTLTPGVTTFVGNNGAGKTNVAESLIFLSFLTSHRTPTNQPLIHLGSDQAVIRAEIVRGDRNLQVDLEINANKANRAKLNQNPTKSQREILGACQVIYFSPEDLDVTVKDNKLIIKGEMQAKELPFGFAYAHKGIAERSFVRNFTLNEYIEVKDVTYTNGMLDVTLQLVLPESKKPKKFQITSK